MTPRIVGYRVVETRKSGRYEYPTRHRLHKWAEAVVTTLRRTSRSSTFTVEPVYAADPEAEMAAAVEALAPQVMRKRYGVYSVPSTSEPGVTHTVAMDREDALHCSCAAGLSGHVCRHVRAVERRRELETATRTERGEWVSASRAPTRAPQAGDSSSFEVHGGRLRARLV